MATVESPITCPRCKFIDAIWEGRTSGQWESVYCPMCGYSESWQAKIDRKHEKKTGHKRMMLTKNQQYIYHHKKEEPAGAYEYRQVGGFGVLGHIKREEDIETAVESLQSGFEKGDLSFVRVSAWDGESVQVLLCLGNNPEESEYDEDIIPPLEEPLSSIYPDEIPF